MIVIVYGALARAEALAAGDPDWMNVTSWPREVPRCTCGPDYTGEAPDERPDCPAHGLDAPAPPPWDGPDPF